MSIVQKISFDIGKRLKSIDKKRVVRNALQAMDDIKNKKSAAYKSPAVGGRWDKPYNRDYARQQGKSPNNVNLRSNVRYVNGSKTTTKSRSIERTKITANKDGKGSIKFRDKDKAVIFGFHQTGTARGRKKRQIYPEKSKQVPNKVTDLVIDTITAEILRQG